MPRPILLLQVILACLPITPHAAGQVITNITLTPVPVAPVNAGDTLQFLVTSVPANPDPQPAYTWSSTNTAVATVDQSGKVTTLKSGEVIIYATDNVTGVKGGLDLAVKPGKLLSYTISSQSHRT